MDSFVCAHQHTCSPGTYLLPLAHTHAAPPFAPALMRGPWARTSPRAGPASWHLPSLRAKGPPPSLTRPLQVRAGMGGVHVFVLMGRRGCAGMYYLAGFKTGHTIELTTTMGPCRSRRWPPHRAAERDVSHTASLLGHGSSPFPLWHAACSQRPPWLSAPCQHAGLVGCCSHRSGSWQRDGPEWARAPCLQAELAVLPIRGVQGGGLGWSILICRGWSRRARGGPRGLSV